MERSISRRHFFQVGAAAVAAGGAAAAAKHADAATTAAPKGMLIDLTKCDGCPDRGTPRLLLSLGAET